MSAAPRRAAPRRAAPCCAMLCCAVLCCAVLCCAVLCCAVMPCCAMHCYAMMCYVVSCCTILCNVMPCDALDVVSHHASLECYNSTVGNIVQYCDMPHLLMYMYIRYGCLSRPFIILVCYSVHAHANGRTSNVCDPRNPCTLCNAHMHS